MTDLETCLQSALFVKGAAREVANGELRDKLVLAAARLFDYAWALNEADPETPPLDAALWH